MKTKKPNFRLGGLLLLPTLFCLSGLSAVDGKEIDLLTPKAISLNKNWILEKGILFPSETPGGIIWSKEQFDDFEISLQYKTSNKANSGLFFRTDPKNAVQGGFEIQIASPGIYSGKHVVGSLYDAKEPMVEAGKPDGEWNRLKLICKGSEFTAHLNGKKIIDLNIDDWNEESINKALSTYQEQNNLKVPQVNQPVRIALTGKTKSPGLGLTLVIFGKELSLKRIEKLLTF